MANIHSVLAHSARQARLYISNLHAADRLLSSRKEIIRSFSVLTPVIAHEAGRVQERVRAFTQAHRLPRSQAWSAVGLLLIAPGVLTFEALAPHSPTVQAAGLNLEVAYAPVVHLGKPTTISLSTMSVFGNKGQFSIRIGKRLTENFSITDITPAPLAIHTSDRGGETLYSFSRGGKDAVTFTLVPRTIGRTAATMQYGLDPPVPFSITTAP